MKHFVPPAKIATPRRSTNRNWLSDFQFTGLNVTVRKTGATTRLNGETLLAVALWVRFWVIVRVVAIWRMLSQQARPAIAFVPGLPRPWYFIRSTAAWGGIEVVGPDAKADAEILFDDATWTSRATPGATRHLNFACVDISKSNVARLFAQTFGYALAVDAVSYHGLAVEKGEINSMHDGRIVSCPRDAIAGRTYQRLIDTAASGRICDLRTSVVGGVPVLVCAKYRKAVDRFASIRNERVLLETPANVFSETEIVQIAAFAKAIGLDWGTLDILRDVHDGRIYIVDANKTDVGPVLALSLADQCRAAAIVGAALRNFIVSP